MSENKPVVVFDTSVLISGLLLAGSIPDQAFDWAATHAKILLSDETLSEFMKVLGRPKFVVYVKPDKAERFLQSLIDLSDLIAITIRIQACRDPADDKFLSLAISGEADCIVTGDEDLLSLNPFQGVAIMTPRQFMNMYVK